MIKAAPQINRERIPYLCYDVEKAILANGEKLQRMSLSLAPHIKTDLRWFIEPYVKDKGVKPVG